ncbi:transposase, partial [Rhodopirellula bahusiensis]|uniref:transposase n=1 Tax=Rhodopirellula bahusiensis TaxID=2014065 RepID=UPI0032988CFB
VVADNGYHSEQVLDVLQNESDLRTYIPEPDRKYQRTWTDKSPQREAAYRRNRRRTKGNRGRRLQRHRSERVERTFAHLCDTGGSRRTWLRGLEKVQKRYMSAAMAYNLGQIMRKLVGAGKPRYAAVLAERALSRLCAVWEVLTRPGSLLADSPRQQNQNLAIHASLSA